MVNFKKFDLIYYCARLKLYTATKYSFMLINRSSFLTLGISIMKKGTFKLLSTLTLSTVVGLFVCPANAFDFGGWIQDNVVAPTVAAFTPPPTPTPTPPPTVNPSVTNTTNSIDSGNLRSIGRSNSSTINPYHAGIVVPVSPVSNEQYANLGVCPANPVCPDINGKTVNNAARNCPDFCTVDRVVNESTIGTIARIVSTTAATCPSGYNVVGTFKVGPEILQNNSPAPAPYPIDTVALYNEYRAAGYSCELVEDSGGWTEQCGGDAWNTSNFSTTLVANPYLVGPTAKVGQYTTGGATSWTYCWNAFGTCALRCSGAGTRSKYMYNFKFVRCTPPPGLFYTSCTVPTSLVCAVRQPTWLKRN